MEALVSNHCSVKHIFVRLSIILCVFGVGRRRSQPIHPVPIDLLNNKAGDQAAPVKVWRRPALADPQRKTCRESREGQPTLVARVGSIGSTADHPGKPGWHEMSREFRRSRCRIGFITAEELVAAVA